MTLTGIVLGLLIVLLLLRVPVGVALGGLSFAGIWYMVGPRSAWGILTAVPYDFISHWTLSSVPMFLLMGYICYHRSEEHTSELQSLMRISYAVFCLKKKKHKLTVHYKT